MSMTMGRNGEKVTHAMLPGEASPKEERKHMGFDNQ